MNTKKNLRDDERAVSPVVGVILMVAITVIMAAVIGAFVYGYGGSMTSTKDVAAVARHQGETIYITFMGGPHQALVSGLNTSVAGTALAASDFSDTTVGSSVTKAGLTGTSNHVIVTAAFTDGTSQVILDTFC